MTPLPFAADAGGITLRVRLTPRGGRDVTEGAAMLADGTAVLKARVRAAPESGEANAALVRLLAAVFGVPKSAVAIVSGASARVKVVRIAGNAATLAEAGRRLAAGG